MTARTSPRSSKATGDRPDRVGAAVATVTRLTKGYEVIRWIEANCVFTNGEWIGQPFRLLPWQRTLVLELFEVQPEDGLRRYRWALVGVPKKNGKTELAAALALYFLLGDGEPSPLVVCAAASDEQADLVFGAARRMCELSPTLSRVTERFEKEITVPSLPGARLRRVAAVAGTNDGQNIHAVICDELHEWQGVRGENVWTVLTNGTGARRQPMVLQITTAGFDPDTVCGQQYDYGTKVASGEIADRRYFFYWASAPADMDIRSEATWRAANPSYGVTVRREFFEDQLKKPESVFRRYFLNQWVSSKETWLPGGLFESLAAPRPLDRRETVVLGFDGSYNQDCTALVACTLDLHLSVVACWERPPGLGPDEWQVPIAEVDLAVREAVRDFNVVEIAADPYRWARELQAWDMAGLPVTAFPNTPARMVPATAKFYDAAVGRRLSHDGDPRLERHVRNCVLKVDAAGPRITKEHRASTRRIDLAAAAVMAVDRASWHAEDAKRTKRRGGWAFAG
jgi:phage terminase large subunit-like protein